MKHSHPIARKTRLRSVSARRSKQLRLYTQKRKAFLAAHPFCQAFIQMHGLDEAQVVRDAGWVVRADMSGMTTVPPATQIHHTNRRHGERLNDERYWLAVSEAAHLWIHSYPSAARLRGWLV